MLKTCYIYIYFISDTIITQIQQKVTTSYKQRSTHHCHWQSFTQLCVAGFQQIAVRVNAYHGSSMLILHERRACRVSLPSCDRASVSIWRHMKTRSLSALLWTITDSVVMRCAKCGKRIPPAHVFFFAISAQNPEHFGFR